MSSNVVAALKDLSTKPQESRLALYQKFLTQLVTSKDTSGIVDSCQFLVGTVGLDQYNRTYIVPPSLVHLLTLIKGDEKSAEDDLISVEDLTPLMKKIVDLLRPKSDDYQDALFLSLDLLSQSQQAEEDFRGAATSLSSFKFDEHRLAKSSVITPSKRAEWYIRAAELWLEVNEIGSASQQIKRAHPLMSEKDKEIKADLKLQLRFKTAYARVLDNERKFLEAAMRYLDLSLNSFGLISEGDLNKTLENAITSAILAKAGPSRSRVLAMLYSDERAVYCSNFGMLEKMYKDSIVRPEEVSRFAESLAEHHKAETSTGLTILQNAMIEHNILAVSKIYLNIKFDQLGALLGIKSKEAEALTATMIEQGRLKGEIDQVEECVEFKGVASVGGASVTSTGGKPGSVPNAAAQSGGSAPSAAAASSSLGGGDNVSPQLRTWDRKIGDTCFLVNRIVDMISEKYPNYVKL